MKAASEITACILDHGLFCGLARRLARDYKRVLYWTPTEKDFPVVNDFILGDGYGEIERIDDFWPVKKDIDLFICPDIQHGGLQLELESQGFAVWGSRHGDTLETDREKFHELLAELGLGVPPFEVVVGLDELRAQLHDAQDKYIKVSKYRGSFETFHWRDWTMDSGALDVWAVQFGPLKNLVRFLVFDAIPTDLEIGGDTYCIDGQFPATMIHGLECKDKGFLGAVTKRDAMPEQVRAVMEAFAPVLKRENYRNLWSMEVRVKDEKSYFIDPCCRFPCPANASQLLLYDNLGEIIWHGAYGELVEPEMTDEFSAEVMLTMKGEKDTWRVLDLPPDLRGNVFTRGSCQVDGHTCLPPHEAHGDEIGYLATTAKTIPKLIEEIQELVGLMPDGVTANAEALYDLLKEVHTAHEEGIEFTDQKVPEPETALEQS